MQEKLDALVGDGSGSSTDSYIKSTKVSQGPKTSAAKSKAEAPHSSPAPTTTATKRPPVGAEVPLSQAAKEARLRRACERKPSGKLKVTEAVHLKWKNGSRADRDELLDTLAECNYDQDCLVFVRWSFWNLTDALLSHYE